jgi:hypothetical protein
MLQIALWKEKPLQEKHHKWRDIITTYPNMKLTFSKDKFPALQELAKKKFVASVAIVGATTTPKGDDATGELSGGELVFRGRGVKGKVVHAGPMAILSLSLDGKRS